jgi:hypothetical protein
MNTDITKVISLLQSAQHPLIVVNKLVPEEYALLTAIITHMQKDSGRKVTLISQGSPEGWLKHVFTHFGVEYNDAVQTLKHVIEIPCGDGSVSSVSYDISGGKFFLYIVPGTAKFDFNQVQFKTFGAQHDVFITLGIQSAEELDKLLGEGKSSVMSAQHIAFGANGTENFQKIVPVAQTYPVETELIPVAKIVLGISRLGKMNDKAKDAVVTFLLRVNALQVKETLFMAEVFRVLGELFKSGVNVAAISQASVSKRPEYTAFSKKVSEKMKTNTQKRVAFASLSKSDVETTGIKLNELIVMPDDLVKALQVSQVMVAIDYDNNATLVYAAGESEEARQIMAKFKLVVFGNKGVGLVPTAEIKAYAQTLGFVADKPPVTASTTQPSTPSQTQSTQPKPQPSQMPTQSQPQSQPQVQQKPQVSAQPTQNPQRPNVAQQPVAPPVQPKPQTTVAPTIEKRENSEQQKQSEPQRDQQTVMQPQLSQSQNITPQRNVTGQPLNFGEIAKRIKSSQ